VVALETAVLTHGLPRPLNLETALAMEAAVRAAGAEPATIGVLSGEPVIGLDPAELERLAMEPAEKVSQWNLAATSASDRHGGTTVSTTIALAHRAGIAVAATGGIGGVHRRLGDEPLDESADLATLATTPILVVCAGAKAVLDLPATLERLETLGVTVAGYGTRELPGFYTERSGLPLPAQVQTPAEAAGLLLASRQLGLAAGVLVCRPPPDGLAGTEVDEWVRLAVGDAHARGVRGRDLTPFLLANLEQRSGGRTLQVNRRLLEANARLAGEIALEVSRERGNSRRTTQERA
jgi:pseudouridine-5'-phosphate glycosidase